jgi:hypothetical protein
MLIPIDHSEISDQVARAMIAEILESWSVEEVRQLVQEMELYDPKSENPARGRAGFSHG